MTTPEVKNPSVSARVITEEEFVAYFKANPKHAGDLLSSEDGKPYLKTDASWAGWPDGQLITQVQVIPGADGKGTIRKIGKTSMLLTATSLSDKVNMAYASSTKRLLITLRGGQVVAAVAKASKAGTGRKPKTPAA